MPNAKNIELTLDHTTALCNLLHLPAIIIEYKDTGDLPRVIYGNPPYHQMLQAWESKGKATMNGAELLNHSREIIECKSQQHSAWSDELGNSFSIELSDIGKDNYILLLHDYSEGCIMASLNPGKGRGCQCILNSMPGGRMVLDRQGVVNTFNQQMQKHIQKFCPAGLKQNSPLEFIGPEGAPQSITKMVDTALRVGKASQTLHREGSTPIELTYNPIYDLNGDPFAVLVSATPLDTSTMQPEILTKLLKQSLDLFGDGYLIWTVNSNELFLSPQFYSQLGYRNNGFKPSPGKLFRLIHPCDRETLKDSFRKLFNGAAQRTEVEFRLRNKSGEYFWVLGRAGIPSYSSENSNPQIVGTTVNINDQMMTKDELMRSDYRLKKAQEIAHVGSWAEYRQAERNDWSDESYRIFGIPKRKSPPSLRQILPMLSPPDRKVVNQILSNVKDQTNKGKLEQSFVINLPKAKVRHVRITAEPNYDASIGKHYWQGVVADITMQKEFETKLKKDKENLLALVENMPALVLATDKNGKLVFWNKSCEEVTGYKAKDLIGNRNALKILYPNAKERSEVKEKLKDMGGLLSTWEHQLTTQKGEKREVVWTAFSDFVQVEGWSAVAIGYDITHQRNNERIQAAYQRKLEAIAETASSLVGIPIDESVYHYLGVHLEKYAPGHIYTILSYSPNEQSVAIEGIYGVSTKIWKKVIDHVSWNPVGRKFPAPECITDTFGQNKASTIEASLYEFADGNISAVAAKGLERLLSIDSIYTLGLTKGSAALGGVVIITRSNQPPIDFSIVEGIVNQAALALDKRQIELQLITAKEKAEEADRLKTAFLANMSHEIRTPMNAILGFSQLLNTPNLTEEKRKQYIDIINIKGNVLVTLINDIIDASKVEAEQLTLVYSPCKPSTLLTNLHSYYQKEKAFQQKDAIDLRLTIPPRYKNLVVSTDEGRIEQVMTNLIGNALKFTPKGFIEFGYSANKSTITFFVRDTGKGIHKRDQELIFDRFRQAEEHTARSHGGTGLGLSICKGIVTLMGGKIWVDAHPNEGSTFYFTIPNIRPSKAESEQQLQDIYTDIYDEITPNWKNRVILIAEDEEVNFIYLNELLEPTGAQLLWAQTGVQAVDLVESIKRIDAILMDIKMPEKDGYAATMEIRQMNASIPIIAQTAYAFSEDREKAIAAGCDDYITKPINGNELFSIIDKHLS